MKPLLSTACWPNLHYFFYVLNAQVVTIEQHEHYPKQSYRNRYQVLSANGVLNLIVPVYHHATKEFTKDVEISYREKWQIKHWRSITSAYKNSPYFDFFEEDIKPFFNTEYKTLLHYNTQQLIFILKLLKVEIPINFTDSYVELESNLNDVRNKVHPKLNFESDELVGKVLQKKYYQTFSEKFEFAPNLSILDLVFNVGLDAKRYLIPKLDFLG